jgi:cytochrome c oxidase cbb3-type subunit 4
MDLLNDLRAAITVIAFATFLGIVFWAYDGRRKEAFERAARMALDDDQPSHDGSGK